MDDQTTVSPNSGGATEPTASRRDVLKAASALAAAFAIGGVAFAGGTETAMAATITGLTIEIPELEAVFAASSFQMGVGRGVSSPGGGGAGRETSPPSFSEITITKPWDEFTALLQFEAVAGDALPEVRFVFTSTEKDKGQVFGTIRILDVLVSGSSLSSGGAVESSGESVSFNYAGIDVSLGGNSYSWDLAANKPL
jgi:type VI secretion system secreted protein Hcp